MKLFLTGEKQIGKSAVIRRFLQESGLRPAGFFTEFTRQQGRRVLYMRAAGLSGAAPVCVAAEEQGHMRALPGAFDRFGPDFLRESGEILILDELGHLEKDAEIFHREVLSALDAAENVLGVLRENLPGWTKEIAMRPDVEILQVTAENRDELPILLKNKFQSR